MKRIVGLLFALLTLVVISACGADNSSEDIDESSSTNENTDEVSVDEVTLKLGHVGSTDSGMEDAAQFLKEKVEEYSDGQMTVEVYPGGQLGGERDLLENVAGGSLEMSMLSTFIFDAQTPVFNGLILPFIFDNSDQLNQVLHGETMNEALNSLEELNLKGFNLYHAGIHAIGTADEPVLSVDDLKGLKIRTPENQLAIDSYKELGAIPTSIPYPDQYSAVQTGVVDGLAHGIFTWYSDGFYEVVDHISIVNAMPIAAATVMNLDMYNELSDDHKEILDKAFGEMEDFMAEKQDEYDEEGLTQLGNVSGLEIHEDIDVEPFREKLQPVYEKYIEQHPLIKGVYEEVQNLK